MAEGNDTARQRYGSCVRCGRALQNLESMRAGMGPTCRAKAGCSDSGRLLEDQPVLVGVPPLVEAGLICRRLEDGRAACNVPQLVVRHSPTGFEWGYGGSGPADLALNVLTILAPERADELHQEFKRAFLEAMPAAGGHVTLPEIRAWLQRYGVAA
jgi:hypothetical protein